MFDNKVKLSDLQLMLMKVLWREGRLSASAVHKLVSEEKALAPTTVSTMLKRMEEKQLLAYQKQGRQFLYYPIVSEDDVKTSMLSNLLANLFDGQPEQLVHHLVDSKEVESSDLTKIKALLAQHKNTDSEKE